MNEYTPKSWRLQSRGETFH